MSPKVRCTAKSPRQRAISGIRSWWSGPSATWSPVIVKIGWVSTALLCFVREWEGGRVRGKGDGHWRRPTPLLSHSLTLPPSHALRVPPDLAGEAADEGEFLALLLFAEQVAGHGRGEAALRAEG